MCMFLRIKVGRAGSVHMYIKARGITEQCLTVGTVQGYACKRVKVHRVYIRTQILPLRAAQHGTDRVLCLVPAALPTAWSYTSLSCFSAPSFSLPAHSEPLQREKPGRREAAHTQFEMLFSRAESNTNILTSGFT